MAKHDPLSRSLVNVAMELHARRLWQTVAPNAAFLIRVPDEASPLVATITGHAGTEYGLVLARGERAMADFVATMLGRGRGRAFMDRVSLLCLDVVPVVDLEPGLRQLSLDAGYLVRHDGLVPAVRSKPPQRRLRVANRTDLRIVRDCVRAILAIHDAGDFAPGTLDLRRRRIFEIVVEGESRDAIVRSGWTTFSEEVAAAAVPKVATFDDLPADLPRLDERWLLSCAAPETSAEDADGDEGEFEEFEEVDDPDPEAAPGPEESVVLVVIEESSRRLVGVVPLASLELDRVAEALKELFLGQSGETGGGGERRRGLPREIAFVSEALRQSLDRALEKLGVATAFVRDHPVLTETLERLGETLDRLARKLEAERELFAPMPKTLSDWKDAERSFTAQIIGEVNRSTAASDRAITRYFGSAVIADEVLRECGGLLPLDGFFEWAFADYRATSRSKTLLEKRRLRRGITSREYALIEARTEATLSLYRIVSSQPGATLEVEDLLTGARSTVHDRALSGCDVEGTVFPLRLLRLGEWTCCIVAGPALGPLQLGRVLHELEAQGVELTPEGLRRESHLLGRLWQLELDSRRDSARGKAPVDLRNTDGEKLEWITATFRVADVPVLRAAFQVRPDVDFDLATNAGCWTRPGAPAPGFGENTVLAHLDLLGEELVVEVNSRRRLARVREWVGRIPGVAFERFTTKEASSKSAPLDDRLESKGKPEPLPPELRAQLESMQREYARRWLDTPVPALQNQTPRAACQTPEGRRRVAILIRTMPDMTIPGGRLPAPRGELLKELGVEAEA
jgi:hypothetical protein